MKNPLLPRLAFVLALGALAAIGLRGGGCFAPRLRIGTFNIRELGRSKTTDERRLAELIAETDVDVLGVQEIMDERALRRLLARLPRRYDLVLSKCGGASKMRVGYLYDPSRVRLVSTTEHQELDPDPSETCATERPGLSAKLERADDGKRLQLLVFHLVMGSEPAKRARRREQWRRAHAIAAKLGEETPVAILGDANSTGFNDDAGGERTFILDEAKNAKLEVVTTSIGCTEYWRPKAGAPLEPSLLDHFVTTPGLARRAPKLWGYCAALACRAAAEDPPDFAMVSDHCPVTIDL